MSKYCCVSMKMHLEMKCDQHDMHECADNVIGKLSDGMYVLLIHDGGTSGYKINYCPFCGAKLGQEQTEGSSGDRVLDI